MFAFLSNFLQKNQIDCFGILSLSDCRLLRPYLLERTGITEGSVLVLAVPYLTPINEGQCCNLSRYAVSKDYHIFFDQLFSMLLPLLSEHFPTHRFAAFADHSPIDEIHAAAVAGLGVIGENRLLLTPKYASYVFLGEIITDAVLPTVKKEVAHCEGCGACRRACPDRDGHGCLSALTQKKGALTPEETNALAAHPLLWGCDICQEVCPHTLRAKREESLYSPIPFFWEERIPYLDKPLLTSLSDAEFAARAYAWRGRETILRNLLIQETQQKGEPPCSD